MSEQVPKLTLATERLFGATGASLISVLGSVVEGTSSHHYEFMGETDFQRLVMSDIRGAMRVYWTEMLYRARFAATAS